MVYDKRKYNPNLPNINLDNMVYAVIYLVARPGLYSNR